MTYLLLSLLLWAGTFGTATSTAPPPNLIIILTDDQGYADVGFNGCTDIPTPNIDRIASEGVVCSNGYVTYAVCGPSRAGLMTGRYQDRFGFGRNPLFAPRDSTMGLPRSEETLAEFLTKAGYRSAALGKWHLGAHPSQRPLAQGFEDFFGFLTGGHRYFPEEWTLADEWAVTSQFQAYRTKLLRNDQRVEEKEYLTDALSREAVGYLQKYQDDPFFLYLAYNAPHAPLQATEKYLERFAHIPDSKRRTYAAMVSAVDDGVGRILDELDRLELTDNTIIVFLSDNGGPESKNGSNNGPLRGGKGDLSEGGIRVPFAIRWPAALTAGQTISRPVISLDIFATMAARLSGRVRPKHSLDGVDLLPYLTADQQTVSTRKLFWRKFDRGDRAMRTGTQKYLTTKQNAPALYELSRDISEEHPLNQPQQLEATQQRYRSWEAEMLDPVFLGLLQDSLYSTLHPNRFKKPND